MSRDAWRRYDREGSWFYDVVAPGFKYNMFDLQAALVFTALRVGVAQQHERIFVAGVFAENALEEADLESLVVVGVDQLDLAEARLALGKREIRVAGLDREGFLERRKRVVQTLDQQQIALTDQRDILGDAFDLVQEV